jgi:tripartite-type tricarboxylate transporter receptor subunit TctC
MKNTWIPFLGLVFAAMSSVATMAQDVANFPSKPIRIIVNFPPGGTVDVMARSVAQKLTEKWGQAVVIDNRPGAGGNIGAQAVALAEPDGYTLLATPPGPMTIIQEMRTRGIFCGKCAQGCPREQLRKFWKTERKPFVRLFYPRPLGTSF